MGVTNPKDVSANYQSGSEDNPLAGKLISFGGVYGEVDDPEKAVDAMFGYLKSESEKEAGGEDVPTFEGRPSPSSPRVWTAPS